MFDDAFAFLKVVSSAVAEATRAVVLDVVDMAGGNPRAEQFGALGMIGRPMPPEGTRHAETIAASRADGYTPFAFRDLRLNEKFPNPKDGEFAWVHYGGGFHSMTLTDNGGTLHILYCPYDFDGAGVPQKAHVITLDPAAEAVSMVHGDGYALVLDKDNGVTARADSTTWWNMKPGEFTCVASKIILQGNVAAGASPATAVPLAAGAASPPSASFFVSSPT